MSVMSENRWSDYETESMLCQQAHCHCQQQVWILTLLLSRGFALFNARLVSYVAEGSTKIKQSRYPHNLGPEKQASALSVIIAHSWAPKAIASHLAFALLCNCYCCHDPFIVRSTRTCPPFTGFTQLAHPSRCSRSTLTTVCFCAFDSSRDHVWSLCMCWCCPSILWWSVGSMVSKTPILQTCNVVVILKQRLASFQHLRSSLL